MGKEIADLIFGAARLMLLRLSDRTLALLIGFIRRLVYAFTGDEELKSILGEVVDIFETGPPGTDIIRKMFREAHKPYTVAVIQGFLEI